MKKNFVLIPLILALVIGLSLPFAAEGEKKGYTAERDCYFAATEIYKDPILTFEAWVNIPSRVTGDHERFTILSNYTIYNESLGFGVSTGGDPCIYYVDGEGKNNICRFNVDDIGTGEWTHIAITVDVDTSSATCYVNGENVGTNEIVYDPLKAYNSPFYISNDGTSGKRNSFCGEIASVTIYSDVRTAGEIEADMTADTPDGDCLIAHYDFSGDVSSEVKDSTGSYDMKFVNQWMKESPMTLDDYAYTFIAVGDTQKLALSHPEEYKMVYNWLFDHLEEYNVQLVMSMGDITNDDTDEEWTLAAEYIRLLDDMVRYTLLRGNHDSKEQLDKYFPYSDYEEFIGGSFSGDSVINSWQEVIVGKIKYLILCLDYTPSDEVLDWANEVVAAHPEHNVIVTTHAYLDCDGEYNTQGENIWEKFTSKHENIVLVLCGHEHSDPILVKRSTGVNGNVVTQMLVDAQSVDAYNTPAGVVALLHFSEDGRNVSVEYISTVKDMYFTPESQFTMELPVIGASSPLEDIFASPITYVVIGVVVVAVAAIIVVIAVKKKK